MLVGAKISEFTQVKKIGQGSFGQIFSVVSSSDGKMYACKLETTHSKRKTIFYETNVLKQLQFSKYFPRYITSGHNNHFNYLIMQKFDLSLTGYMRKKYLTFVSPAKGLQIAYHVLKAIETMHSIGYIHRDIKSSNIMIQNDPDFPIALIDFGLSRQYLDKTTGKPYPPREKSGFIGTSLYASYNSHQHKDLGRRDDLISWFFMITDLITAQLPWRTSTKHNEIMQMKKEFNPGKYFLPKYPEMCDIWDYISSLAFEDTPDYERIYQWINIQLDQPPSKSTDKLIWFSNGNGNSISEHCSEESISKITDYYDSDQGTPHSGQSKSKVNSSTSVSNKEAGNCCNIY